MPDKLTDSNLIPTITADFELFFRLSVDPMIIVTREGALVDLNHAYEKILSSHNFCFSDGHKCISKK